MNVCYLNEKELKKELTKILKEVDSLLKEHQLTYSIYGGTLLGAVRHKGFIPWDDDIDIALLRPDYNKLVSILSQNNKVGKNLKGIGFELGEKDWPFIKIINTEIFVDEELNGVDKNLWIDIFPIDGIPNHLSKIHLFKIHYIFRRLFFYKRADVYGIEHKNSRNIIKNAIELIQRNISRSMTQNTITRQYIKQCAKYNANECKTVGEVVWGNERFPREFFEDIKDYEFESILVRGFENSDNYLKIMYGDYMKMPPEGERVNHGIKVWRNVGYEEQGNIN